MLLLRIVSGSPEITKLIISAPPSYHRDEHHTTRYVAATTFDTS